MASIITGAARAAHSAAATILSAAEISVGEQIPIKHVKEDDPKIPFNLDLSGKNILLGVPGAFTPTCSSQVPDYIKGYDEIKQKGVNNIYVVSVNDAFVTKAWKNTLAPTGTGVRFIADDKGEFTGSLGLVFDATDALGGLRCKRFVIVAIDGEVKSISVEENPGQLSVTACSEVLSKL